MVLYVPEFGYEDAPLGDELMEWLNVHFIEPSTEEGDHLSSLDDPWEDETFWPYLTRFVRHAFCALIELKCSVYLELPYEVFPRHPCFSWASYLDILQKISKN